MALPVTFYGKPNGGPIQISFGAANAANGFPLDRSMTTEERMMANGVPGARWRDVSEQFPEDQWTTIEPCAAFSDAVNRAHDYASLKGELIQISALIGGTTYQWKNVHVSNVVPKPQPGMVVGSSIASAGAHIIGVWTLEFTDFTNS